MPARLNRSRSYDPIGPVARDIASHTHLLCFDEFQVSTQSCNIAFPLSLGH